MQSCIIPEQISSAGVRGEEGDPGARLGSMGWTCIGSPEGKQWTGARSHISRTLFTPMSASAMFVVMLILPLRDSGR